MNKIENWDWIIDVLRERTVFDVDKVEKDLRDMISKSNEYDKLKETVDKQTEQLHETVSLLEDISGLYDIDVYKEISEELIDMITGAVEWNMDKINEQKEKKQYLKGKHRGHSEVFCKVSDENLKLKEENEKLKDLVEELEDERMYTERNC